MLRHFVAVENNIADLHAAQKKGMAVIANVAIQAVPDLQACSLGPGLLEVERLYRELDFDHLISFARTGLGTCLALR